MTLLTRKNILSISKISAASIIIGFASVAHADMFTNAGQTLSTYTLDCSHWYAGANIGMSHMHDNPSPGTGDSVNENGPGWSVVGGYQLNSLLGGELGYTQYYKTRETLGSANIATTDHFAVHLAATGRYPLFNKFSAIGKLGVGYSYANKIFTASTAAGSAGSVSPYYGVGIGYSVTQKVDFIVQWARSQGNDYTGSGDFFSAGFNFAIV
ncbi:MAG: hypothetical protein ACD_46C00524G0005 [uncultured bacterium]|nr:MAG: hypothetical protein ACD_46C00524G0005 [uncultured bacterium]